MASGHIVQLEPGKTRSKCRKWKLVLSLGRDPQKPGKYLRKQKRFSGTYTEAKEALALFLSENQTNTIQQRHDLTLNEWVAVWHSKRLLQANLSQRTLNNEIPKLKNVLNLIGNAYLKDITPDLVNSCYQRLMNGESVSGKPLSSSYVASIHRYLFTCLKEARYENLVTDRTLRAIKAPKIQSKEKYALRIDEVASLLQKLNPNNYFELAVLICLATGLRRSEVLALTWNDFDGQSLRVNKSLNENATIKETKTRSSNRTVPLPSDIAETLSRLNPGGDFSSCPIICEQPFNYLRPDSFSQWWSRNRKRFGVSCSIHEFRHTYLTSLVTSGVNPRLVQELAGHSSLAVTMEVYTHIQDEQKRQAVNDTWSKLRSE